MLAHTRSDEEVDVLSRIELCLSVVGGDVVSVQVFSACVQLLIRACSQR